MKMIPAVPGSNKRETCPDCKRSYNTAYGHACTSRKKKVNR